MNDSDIRSMFDEISVRKVLDEYCLRMEVNAFDDWLDLFTDDTIYEVYGSTLRGREEVGELLSKAPHGVHIGGAVRIVISGDTADTLQNYMFVSTSTDEWNVGWYHRTLRRTADGWKIAHTKVKFGRKDPLAENERARKLRYPIIFS